MKKREEIKLTLYLKCSGKPIVLTDDCDSVEDSVNTIKTCMSSGELIKIQTKKDVLLIWPSEISGMLITCANDIVQNQPQKKQKIDKVQPPDQSVAENKQSESTSAEYSDILIIESN